MKLLLHSVRASKLALVSTIPNDNHGTWFLAKSKLAVKHLEQKFHSQKLGRVLFERVGGLVQGPRRSIYIQLQLVTDAIVRVDFVSKEPVWARIPSYARDANPWPEWGVEVCLEEIGVELQEVVPALTVLTAYHVRGRA